jgi:hypothetical protein
VLGALECLSRQVAAHQGLYLNDCLLDIWFALVVHAGLVRTVLLFRLTLFGLVLFVLARFGNSLSFVVGGGGCGRRAVFGFIDAALSGLEDGIFGAVDRLAHRYLLNGGSCRVVIWFSVEVGCFVFANEPLVG